MAAPRLPESDMPAVTKPVASLVDTFVRPRQPTLEDQSGLLQIASSLKELSPAMARLAGDGAYRQRQKDVEEGVAAGQRGEVTPETASEHRRRAQEETLGKYRDASDADAARQAAWNDPNNSERNTTDPKVLEQWMTSFRNERLQGMSPDRQRGFLSQNAEYEQRLLTQFNATRQQRVDEESTNTLQTSMVGALRQALREGKSAAEALQVAQQSSIALQYTGLRGSLVNHALGNALLTVAQETKRPDILQAAMGDRQDIRNPGQVIRGLGGEWDTRLTGAVHTIKSWQAADEARSIAASNQARITNGVAGIAAEERVFQSWTDAVKEARAQGKEPPPPPSVDAGRLAAIERYDPRFLSQRRSAIETVSNARDYLRQTPEDYRRVTGDLRDRISRGEEPGEAYVAVLDAHKPTDPTIINNLQQDVRLYQQRNPLSAPEATAAMQQVAAMVTTAERLDKPQAGLLAAEAQRFFRHGILNWESVFRTDNGGRSPTGQERFQAYDALGKQAAEYVSAWTNQADVTKAIWRPGEQLPMPSATATPATPSGAPQAARVEQRSGTDRAPPEAPPADPRNAPVGAAAGRAIRNTFSGIGNLLAAPQADVPIRVTSPTGDVILDGNPIAFPETMIRRYGVSGADGEITWSPSRTWSPPSDAQVTSLLVGLRRKPDDAELVQEFDQRFGKNAALFYVRQYNRAADRNPG